MLKGAGLELILVVDHHHGILIVVIRIEARCADHSSSVFPDPTKLRRQKDFLQPQRPQHARLWNVGEATMEKPSPCQRLLSNIEGNHDPCDKKQQTY